MNTAFLKKCPMCGKDLYYKCNSTLIDSIRKGRKCKKCAKAGTTFPAFKNGKFSDDILKKMSKTWFKKGHRPKNADFRKGKTWEEIYGIDKSNQIKHVRSTLKQPKEANERRRISCIKSGCGRSNKGKRCSDELKKLYRKQMVERLAKTHQKFHPSYNIKACEYFNKLMMENKCYIQHAMNDGEFYIKELGYWVDGYDKENNIVYEWDERYHFNVDGTLIEKDIKRQKEIEDFLKCKFVRIKESDIC